jgi:plasmid stability protein
MKGASQIAPFGLRMPEELKDKLAERASANGRSLNSEILFVLTRDVAVEGNPDQWLEKLIEMMNATDTSTDKGRAMFTRAVAEAIRDITRRIDVENNRLRVIADAHRKIEKSTEPPF